MSGQEIVSIFLPSRYRIPMPVVTHRVIDNAVYPVCPRCRVTLEREYQRYCDRCGQRLSWIRY